MDYVETLANAPVPLHVTGHAAWESLRCQVRAAQRKSELRRAEDPVDAVVCAYVALFAQHRPTGVTVYGDSATGNIVTPSLPAGVLTIRKLVDPPVRALDQINHRRHRGGTRITPFDQRRNHRAVYRADQRADQFDMDRPP